MFFRFLLLINQPFIVALRLLLSYLDQNFKYLMVWW